MHGAHVLRRRNRIDAVREMILADDDAGRAKALKKIKAFHTRRKTSSVSSKHLMVAQATIRLLDPPLHEFIGTMDAEAEEGSLQEAQRNERSQPSRKRIHSLHEENPMLGHRGCRLGISYPAVTADAS